MVYVKKEDKIAVLPFSVRVRNCLKQENIETIGDLLVVLLCAII